MLTSREAVLSAIRERERIGRAAFLEKYGFGPSRWYQIVYRRKEYDSKAIAGAALAFQYGSTVDIHRGLHGGLSGVVAVLRRLGFTVVDLRERAGGSKLAAGTTSIGPAVVAAELLKGVEARLRHDSGGAAVHTIYAKGARVAEVWVGKRVVRLNLIRAPVAPPAGSPDLTGTSMRWPGQGTQVTSTNLAACRALLMHVIGDTQGQRTRTASSRVRSEGSDSRSATRRVARPFDPKRPPTSYRVVAGKPGVTPEEKAALHEKANVAHHRILVTLEGSLRQAGWRQIEEVERATDLRATTPSGTRVLFEAKSLSGKNQSKQVRAALAQLLEYRFLGGRAADKLCLATNGPIEESRTQFLRTLGIDVVWTSEDGIRAAARRPIVGALAKLQ